MRAFAAGKFVNNGDAQHVQFILRGTTDADSADITDLFLNDNQTERLMIPENKVLSATVTIVGTGTALANGDNFVHVMRKLSITRDSIGGTYMMSGPHIIGTDKNDNGAVISITADNIHNALNINVTASVGVGGTSNIMRWVAYVDGIEVGIVPEP